MKAEPTSRTNKALLKRALTRNKVLSAAVLLIASSGESVGGLTRFSARSCVLAFWEVALALPSNQLLKKAFI
jgi:hypothetical protein